MQISVPSFSDLKPFERIVLVVRGSNHGIPKIRKVTEAVVAFIDPDGMWLITCAGRLLTWADLVIVRRVIPASQEEGPTLLPATHTSAKAHALHRALTLPLESPRPGDGVCEV